MNRLQPVALGVALGILGAAYIFIVGITAIFGWGAGIVEPIGTFYIGYGPTIGGAIIGAIWAFVDGFIAGVVIAWLYNMLAK